MSGNILSLLREPSELREAEAHKILAHLYDKQNNMQREPTFRISHYIDTDGKLVKAHSRTLAIVPKQRKVQEESSKQSKAKSSAAKGKQKAVVRRGGKGKKKMPVSAEEESDDTEQG